jgi:hypothetical protein
LPNHTKRWKKELRDNTWHSIDAPWEYPDIVLLAGHMENYKTGLAPNKEYRVIIQNRFYQDLTPENISPFPWRGIVPCWFARDKSVMNLFGHVPV